MLILYTSFRFLLLIAIFLLSHGQFGMMKDKRTPYEFDIHLPAYVRGPNIKAGITVADPITNTDFYPTFLEIAGNFWDGWASRAVGSVTTDKERDSLF